MFADNGSPQMILVFIAMFVATVDITGSFFNRTSQTLVKAGCLSSCAHVSIVALFAICSGIIIIAGMLQVSADNDSPQMILVFIAMFVATVNIAGGFLVTQRMLNMFLGEQNSSKGKRGL